MKTTKRVGSHAGYRLKRVMPELPSETLRWISKELPHEIEVQHAYHVTEIQVWQLASGQLHVFCSVDADDETQLKEHLETALKTLFERAATTYGGQ